MKLTPGTAKLTAAVMIGAAFLWSRYETRAIPAVSIGLASLPQRAGEWTRDELDFTERFGIEALTADAVYTDPEGHEAQVTYQGTYTRLGALRDWSLARTTGGWTITREMQQTIARADGTGQMTVRMQELIKEGDGMVAISWYASPDNEATSLARAEMRAWRDRLVGHTNPWLSMYIILPTGEDIERATAETMALDLASHLGPQLRAVARDAEP